MFRRRGKDGRPAGAWYYHHPVTGKKVSSGTTVKQLAKEKLEALEREAHDRALGKFVEPWEVMSENWMGLNKHLANYPSQEAYHAFWRPHLNELKPQAITKALVHEIIVRERPVNLVERTPANATANNYVRFVAKILRASEVEPPRFHTYPAPKQGKGALRPEQWATWRDAMPAELRWIVTFSLATGLRITNVRKFEWDWLHGDRAYLPVTVTKTDKPYGIPLNKTAMAVIEEIKRQTVRHQTYVFTKNGAPWGGVKGDWLLVSVKASSKAALGFEVTPHWMRHTFRTWLAQEGVADSVARRLGCWKLAGGADSGYLHFDVEPLRRFSEVLDAPLTVSLLSHPSEKTIANQ